MINVGFGFLQARQKSTRSEITKYNSQLLIFHISALWELLTTWPSVNQPTRSASQLQCQRQIDTMIPRRIQKRGHNNSPRLTVSTCSAEQVQNMGTAWLGYHYNYLQIRMTLITELKCYEVSLSDMQYLSLAGINSHHTRSLLLCRSFTHTRGTAFILLRAALTRWLLYSSGRFK